MKEFKIEDEKVEKMIEKSNKNLTRVEWFANVQRGFIFNGNLMKFKPNAVKIDAALLGAFVYEKLLPGQATSNDEVYKKMELRDAMKSRGGSGAGGAKAVSIESLANEQFFIAYLDEQSYVSAVVVAKNGNVVL